MFNEKEHKISKRTVIGSIMLSLILVISTFLWNCKVNGCWTDDWIMLWGVIGYPVYSVMSTILNNVIDFVHMSDGSTIGISMIILSVVIEFLFFGVVLGIISVFIFRLTNQIKSLLKKKK